MKKLTASIFTVLLATVGAANAEIASRAYVDERDTASVTTANTYTDTKIGNLGDNETVAAAIAAAVSAGVDNAVTHTGAVGNATTPVYVTAEGVATAGTALGTMAYEAAADYSKTGADTTYAKQSDFTTLQSAVNNETTGLAATKAIADANKSAIENATTGLAATKAIADAADTLSKANKATLDGLDADYVKETELTTTLSEYTKTGADTTYAKASDFTTLQSAVNNETTGLAATNAKAVAADTLSKANKAELDALDETYAKTADLGTAAFTASTAYATAAQGTLADNALPKATYDSQVGTVSAANMGTTASTVVTAIKEVHDSVAALGDTYATDQELSTALEDYTPTANLGDLATLDEVGSAQITNGSVATEDIADHAVTLAKVPALSSDCQATGAECVLKSASGALAWEVIKRADNGQ